MTLDPVKTLTYILIKVGARVFLLDAPAKERHAPCSELSIDILEHSRPRPPEGDREHHHRCVNEKAMGRGESALRSS